MGEATVIHLRDRLCLKLLSNSFRVRSRDTAKEGTNEQIV